ncbi:MAG: hypothetical protein OEU91_03830 [Gammaproteobacteria bacterium]|nr:hypothetical protein [Gammaproteobacteria bacterium]
MSIACTRGEAAQYSAPSSRRQQARRNLDIGTVSLYVNLPRFKKIFPCGLSRFPG